MLHNVEFPMVSQGDLADDPLTHVFRYDAAPLDKLDDCEIDAFVLAIYEKDDWCLDCTARGRIGGDRKNNLFLVLVRHDSTCPVHGGRRQGA